MSFMDIKSASGRFDGITRPYTEQDVQRLRGSVKIENTLAQRGAEKLWELLKNEPYVHALGALSGNQVGGAGCGDGFKSERVQGWAWGRERQHSRPERRSWAECVRRGGVAAVEAPAAAFLSLHRRLSSAPHKLHWPTTPAQAFLTLPSASPPGVPVCRLSRWPRLA